MHLWETYGLGPTLVALVGLFLGGFVKGAVGFALPMVAVAVASTALPAKTAVALIIIPVLVTNIWQVAREERRTILSALRRFWPLNATLCVVIWISAGFLPAVDERAVFLLMALLIAAFLAAQLGAGGFRLAPRHERPAGLAAGAVSGVCGGLSGMWGPPTVVYLTALGLDKRAQVMAAGLAFALGSLMLAPAHLASGILTAPIALASVIGLIPALAGQALGQAAQDRMDLDLFRRATLVVLAIAGLNLARRALLS